MTLLEKALPRFRELLAVAYNATPRDDDVLLVLDTAAGLIAQSVASLHTLVTTGAPVQLDGVTRKKLDALREIWKGDASQAAGIGSEERSG